MNDRPHSSAERRKPRGTPWWRWLITLALGGMVLIAGLYYLASAGRGFDPRLLPISTERFFPAYAPGGGPGHRDISPFTAADQALNEQQLEFVRALARRHVGTELRGDSGDLRILQALIDQGIVRPDQTFELQALGVALGEVFRSRFGLTWVTFRDESGRSRAMQFRHSDNLIFPTTMISRRIEAGAPVDVARIFEEVSAELARL
jgi:hypothetical protein